MARDIDFTGLQALSRTVALSDVCMWSVAFRRFAHLADGELSFTPQIVGISYDYRPSEALRLMLKYAVSGTLVEEEGGPESLVFSVETSWLAAYQLAPHDPFSDDALGDFAWANGQLHTFPYVRSFVTDLTARSGVPPLVIPVYRVPRQRPEVTRVEDVASEAWPFPPVRT